MATAKFNTEMKILIADDTDSVRFALRLALEYLGHEVVGFACDGHEAIEKYASMRPDLIVMDVRMPRMDGLTCTSLLSKADPSAKVEMGFSSIFWNTAWTHRQAPTTLGILCDPRHPALAEFPTEYHSNWQWWYLISQAGAMILDDLPKELRPIVQVIDDWVTARKLGLVFEARMGAGRLCVCSIDLRKDPEHNPVARQMLHSLLRYMNSSSFKPAVALSPAEVRSLMAPPH